MTELLGHVAIINGVLRLYIRHKDEDDMPQCPALIHTFRDHPLLRRARADLGIAPPAGNQSFPNTWRLWAEMLHDRRTALRAEIRKIRVEQRKERQR